MISLLLLDSATYIRALFFTQILLVVNCTFNVMPTKRMQHTNAHQTWFDEAVYESLACNWGLIQLYLQRIFGCDHQKRCQLTFLWPSGTRVEKNPV